MTALLGAVLTLWALAQAGAQGQPLPADELAAAKALYASGAYEEALTRLSAVKSAESADEVDQYRALCLLALGRIPETERSLEELVARRPLFKMSEADVSPRLITLFQNVRRRTLAAAARSVYGKGKQSFDQKDYAAASTHLKELLLLLDDEDLDMPTAAATDLRLLGDGFLRLAQAELAAAEASALRAATPPPPEPVPAEPPAGRLFYSIADADVVAPLDISRPMPPWRPPNRLIAAREFRGILSIVINEQGRVEMADLVDPIVEGFDQLLLQATRQWVFRPAMRNGVPVKYQKEIPIVLAPAAR